MPIKYLTVASHGNDRTIAYCHEQPHNAQASIFWLSGYCSVMNSTKATAIAQWAAQQSIEMIRFDYSGLGESSGEFSEATFSQWLAEALAIYQLIQHRPTIIVGSSMGAWQALRLTEEIIQLNLPEPSSMLLLAPAADFTHEVLLKQLNSTHITQIQQQGFITLPSQYELEALTFHRTFLEDAANERILNRSSCIETPITIIHGEQDIDIPLTLAIKTAAHFKNTQLITVHDAEHRLSRDCDIQLILQTLQSLLNF